MTDWWSLSHPEKQAAAEQLDLLAGVHERADDIDKAVIRQVILGNTIKGTRFSANDIRDWLPKLTSKNTIGAVFAMLKAEGYITRCRGEYVPSTEKVAHGRPVAVWMRNYRIPPTTE